MGDRPLLRIKIDDDTDLRIYEERHAREVAALVDRNRAYLRQWLPWVDFSRSVEDSKAFIQHSLQQFARNEGFQLASGTKVNWLVVLVIIRSTGLIGKSKLATGLEKHFREKG